MRMQQERMIEEGKLKGIYRKDVRVMVKRVSVTEAAAILGTSPQFIRIAMQQGVLRIGACVKMSSIWTYNISPKLLADYCGKDIEEEVRKLREKQNGGA